MTDTHRGMSFPSFPFDPDTFDPEKVEYGSGEHRHATVYFMLEGYKKACMPTAPIQRMPISDVLIHGMITSLCEFLYDLVGPEGFEAWMNTIRVQMELHRG